MKPNQIAILKKLKSELEYGDNTEIAKRTDFTPEYVGMCLNPKKDNYNSKIVDAALALIEERKKKEEEMLDKLNNAA